MRKVTHGLLALLPILAALSASGCHTDMWVQPRHQTYDQSEFYPDGQSSRPLVNGTIPRAHLREDGEYFTGTANGRYIADFPAGIKVDRALLDRGQERFDVYCSPCHGRLGTGQGMIAQRGFTLKRPVGNYHTDRLRRMPNGHFYDVITNGYGAMYSYASRVQPEDRWAIVAYIRVLQQSQSGTAADLPGEALSQLRSDPKAVVVAERGAARNIAGSSASKTAIQRQGGQEAGGEDSGGGEPGNSTPGTPSDLTPQSDQPSTSDGNAPGTATPRNGNALPGNRPGSDRQGGR